MTLHDELQIEVGAGRFTAAEQLEQEATGEISLSPILELVGEYNSVIDRRCFDHKTIIITAIRRALDSGVAIEEIKKCLDAKISEFAGCVACRSVSN